jgi:hypothetical protein
MASRSTLADSIRTTYSHWARTGKVPREGELVELMRASACYEARDRQRGAVIDALRPLVSELPEFVAGGTRAAIVACRNPADYREKALTPWL